MSGVHQFVPMLHREDAVGQHALAVQALLRARGVPSEVYVELPDPETVHLTRPVASYPEHAAPGDVLVYQFATPSPMARWLAGRDEVLVVNYHNITPPECFAPWDNLLARRHVAARDELSALAGRARLGVAVSEFNRADLVAAGFAETRVVPPVVHLLGPGDAATPSATVAREGADSHPEVEPETKGEAEGEIWGSTGRGPGGNAPARPGSTGSRWLTVGRLAPNKAVELVVEALLVHRVRHDAGATLSVVGRPALASYARALHAFVAELGLAGAVRFEGRLGDDALRHAYRSSDVLVVASEHEGFCLPVVEAMAHDLPVVARRRGAIPEVLGDAGILVDAPGPFALSDAIAEVVGDPGVRHGLVDAGRRRLATLALADAGAQLVELLLSVRAPAGRAGS